MPATRLSSRVPCLLVVLTEELQEHRWLYVTRGCSCGWVPKLHGRGDPSVLHSAHLAVIVQELLDSLDLLTEGGL